MAERFWDEMSLLESEMPTHLHAGAATVASLATGPAGCGIRLITVADSQQTNRDMLARAGGKQPRNRMPPHLSFYFHNAPQGLARARV